LTKKFKRKFFV
jgi:serine/threonine protein kinase